MSSVIAIVTGLVVTYVLYRIFSTFLQWRYMVSNITKLPGYRHHPIVGVLAEFEGPNENGLAFMRRLMDEYPRLLFTYFGPFRTPVTVHHPETVKQILKTSEPKPKASGAYKYVFPWLGDGLLISSGKKWARNRRLLTPAFHFEILKPYVTINNNSAEILMQKLSLVAARDEYFEVFSFVSLCTLEIILKCAFSYGEDVQSQGENNAYVTAVRKLSNLTVYRALRPWLFSNWIFFLTPSGWEFKKHCDFVHTVSDDVIRSRKQTLSTNTEAPKKKILDFLDILLTAKDEHGKGLTDREIRDEVDTFLFEGHDTTASGISWTLYALAGNPEWQEKCRDEIGEILEGRDSDEILWEDIAKMKVLSACIKETLRLHAPVPFIQRQLTKDMYLDGHWLPRDTIVNVQLYGVLHNPAVWDDPMEFKPGRFSSDSERTMDSYAFVPFSAGPRNCIGQNFAMHEMKVVVSRILHRFVLEVDPLRPARHQITVVMKTESGMYLKATPRTN